MASQALQMLMKLRSYIVVRDYGFAPNPFYGWCTLATCKPRIRGLAEIGDWVIGTGAKVKYKLAGHLIFAMRVEEACDFDAYWNDPRFSAKKPVLNGSLKQIYGDNIYHKEHGRWKQEDSHHSYEKGEPNPENIKRDTSYSRVLISRRFVYFGDKAPAIPEWLKKKICCSGEGHCCFPQELAEELEKWLEKRGSWGLQGIPLEFRRHKRWDLRLE